VNPHIHAKSSARRYGGVMEDYLDIHEYMDCSKDAVADVRHRILTHTPFFCERVIGRVFGSVRQNSEGKDYSPKQVAYDHIEEDFKGQIPATADWFLSLEFADWMQNGRTKCPSHAPLARASARRKEARLEKFAYGG